MGKVEEEEIITTEELKDESLLEGINEDSELFDIIHDYLISLRKFPLLSDEETKDLLVKYRVHGNLQAREKLINHNLRLVVWYIRHRRRITKSHEFIDLVQIGNIALIKAVDTFDMTYGTTLATYATRCMSNEIHRELANNDRTIRIPSGLVDLINKYRIFKNHYLNVNGHEATPEEICEYLNINSDKLKEIEETLRNIDNLDSLNRELKDEESATLEEFIEDTNNAGYDQFEKRLDEKILCYKIKKVLSPKEYYIVYHHILMPNKISLRSLGIIFGVSFQRIENLINTSLAKLKRLKIYERKVDDDIKNIINLDVRPIDFKKKVVLLYLKDCIPEEDYNYLYYTYYLGIEDERYIRKYHLDKDKFKEFKEYIESTYTNIFSITPEFYSEIFEKIKRKFTVSQIFDADITTDFDKSFSVKEKLDKLSKEELMEYLKNDYGNFTKDQKDLIEAYYDDTFKPADSHYINLIDAKINLSLLGYKGERTLPTRILYDVYIKNKDLFDSEYQDFLEGTLFRDITGKKVPYDITMGRRKNNTIRRLSQLYYRIDNFFTYEIPEKETKRIIKQYDYLFTEDEIRVIKLHYINPNGNLTIKELMTVLNNDNKYEVNSLSRQTYQKVVSLYLGIFHRCIIKNEEIYMKYISNPNFRMVPQNREVCRMRFQDHLDYKEIRDKLGLESTQRVSNIIGKSLILIDMHHYNVNNDIIYEEDMIHELFAVKDNYTPQEEDIIISRYIENMSAEEICSKHNINKTDYMNLISRFSNAYLSFFADKNITKEDVQKELFVHPSDCVLNATQKAILSFIYGVTCPDNPKGEILSKEEIKNRLNIDENSFNNNRKLGQVLLGCKKRGIVGSELGRLTQDEVRDSLMDPNVPLKQDEKLLLRQIKGIDTETKTLDELAKIHGVNKGSIRRRVMLAYLSILKYQDGLKEKIIDYEVDVVPLLKYFPLIEQYQLTDLYCNHFEANDFVKKYNITKEQAWVLMERLERRLCYLIKYPKARKFDFDYAREILDKEDLPFFGYYELARYYYDRYFGDDGKLPDSRGEIIGDLNISGETKTSAMIRDLMIACLMYKGGYRKYKTVDISEIEAYYNEHKESLPGYLDKVFKSSIRQNDPTKVSELAIYEILKSKGEDIFHLKNISKYEAISILRDNPYNFSSYQLEVIRNYFKIPKKDLMNGKSKHKLYKLVGSYILKKNPDNKKLQLHG